MNDWGGYKGLALEAKADAEEDRAKPLVDCPVCGEPLETNNRGAVNCPLGHFRQGDNRKRY